MRFELLYQRALAALLLAALVFAPAPSSGEKSPISPTAQAETLVGRILSPTFDEGVIRKGIRSSFSAFGKQRDSSTNWAVAALLQFSGLLLPAVLIALKQISHTYLIGLAPLGSRAPPHAV